MYLFKKMLIVAMGIGVLLFSTGCIDVYYGKKPSTYKNSEWICEEYNLSFLVDAEGLTSGKATIDGEDKTVYYLFDYGVGIEIRDENTHEIYLTGTCEFEKKQFTVIVTEEDIQQILDPSVCKLVFRCKEES